MAILQRKRSETPDEVRTFPHGEVTVVNLGDVSIASGAFQPGWHWAEHVKPLVGTESCQVHHAGYLKSGRIGRRMDDGTAMEFGPGDVDDIPPGHDGWVIGDEPAVELEIAGAAVFAKPR